MKFILMALLSLSALASTTEVNVLNVEGTESFESQFDLSTEKTHTEYRTETRAETCYRTVIVGYENRCDTRMETVCGGNPPICTTRPVTICHNEPVYRQVPYTCYREVKVPFEVYDYSVKTTANVKLGERSRAQVCQIEFAQTGESLSEDARNCGESIVYSKRKMYPAEYDNRGKLKLQKVDYEINFEDAAQVLAPIRDGIKNMHLEGQLLVFQAGDLTDLSRTELKLFVERRKFLRSDKTLINRILKNSEFEVVGNQVRIDLAKLFGGINRSKKHALSVELKVRPNVALGETINKHNFVIGAGIVVND